jgi:hypothetical protein
MPQNDLVSRRERVSLVIFMARASAVHKSDFDPQSAATWQRYIETPQFSQCDLVTMARSATSVAHWFRTTYEDVSALEWELRLLHASAAIPLTDFIGDYQSQRFVLAMRVAWEKYREDFSCGRALFVPIRMRTELRKTVSYCFDGYGPFFDLELPTAVRITHRTTLRRLMVSRLKCSQPHWREDHVTVDLASDLCGRPRITGVVVGMAKENKGIVCDRARLVLMRLKKLGAGR